MYITKVSFFVAISALKGALDPMERSSLTLCVVVVVKQQRILIPLRYFVSGPEDPTSCRAAYTSQTLGGDLRPDTACHPSHPELVARARVVLTIHGKEEPNTLLVVQQWRPPRMALLFSIRPSAQ